MGNNEEKPTFQRNKFLSCSTVFTTTRNRRAPTVTSQRCETLRETQLTVVAERRRQS